MVICPQCGGSNAEEERNCQTCRVNLYWAYQHYEELAARRTAQQLTPQATSPAFLLVSSRRVDRGPSVGWLRASIRRFGLREAGARVSTMSEKPAQT